jgi:Protein of unknown function (DUF4058)
MPSPFPGMDPYLESHWRDVHHRLITYASDAIQEALPADLRARVEERVVMEDDEGLGNPFFPDARVIEGRPGQGGVTTVTHLEGSSAILVDVEHQPLTEGFIEIIDVNSGNRVVTIIEVLSPTNKIGIGRREYQRKQQEIVQSDTNLVEIDLLRAGSHVVAVPLANITSPRRRRTPYLICVRRVTMRTKAEVHLIPLSAKLPTVLIPLRPGDADVPLDLQALIEQCYRKGRYEGDLNYRLDPDPPFTGPDAEWAVELLRSKGLRSAETPKKKRTRKPPRASGG